ncbi:TPA: DUF4400 domain-containing protein, partial [Escherichia coli]|nr:DUF4400 domain-containing protein [Escherichia coli]
MAADNTSRAAVLRTMLFFGMVIYFGYSLAFQNTEELKYQITQEVNASRSIISNDRWKSVIANSEATLNWLVHDYKLIDYLNTILIPDTKKPARGINIVAEKFTSINYTMAKNIPLLLYQSIFRWNLILGWLIVFLPYLFAMLADGMYQWKLKRYVFGKVTVQFYRIWFRAFWVISALTMVYLVMPNM